MKKDSLGIHILLSLFDCKKDLLVDADIIKNILNDATLKAGLTKVGESFYQFYPEGATGVLLLSESHICIHTWPEFNTAAVDIFSCGDESKAVQASQRLIELFEAKSFERKILYR